MSLSVVIPVYNAVEYLKQTLWSLEDNVDLDELILIDDGSEFEVAQFLDSIVYIGKRLIVKHQEHSWFNKTINYGVSLATSDYILVLNSDVQLSKDLDKRLIDSLASCTIACPYEQVGKKLITLDPMIKKVHPEMIKGACFMFKKSDRDKLFPIPDSLTHWYGDRYLANRASKFDGVKFNKEAIIKHAITQSGRLIDKKLYYTTIYRDLLNYEKMTGTREFDIKVALRGEIAKVLPNFDYSVFYK